MSRNFFLLLCPLAMAASLVLGCSDQHFDREGYNESREDTLVAENVSFLYYSKNLDSVDAPLSVKDFYAEVVRRYYSDTSYYRRSALCPLADFASMASTSKLIRSVFEDSVNNIHLQQHDTALLDQGLRGFSLAINLNYKKKYFGGVLAGFVDTEERLSVLPWMYDKETGLYAFLSAHDVDIVDVVNETSPEFNEGLSVYLFNADLDLIGMLYVPMIGQSLSAIVYKMEDGDVLDNDTLIGYYPQFWNVSVDELVDKMTFVKSRYDQPSLYWRSAAIMGNLYVQEIYSLCKK